MSIYCREVHERVEKRIKKTRERCKKKKCKWWCGCCNKWFCWLETYFLTVVSFPIRVVCEVVDGVLSFVGIFTSIIARIPLLGRLIRQLWGLLTEIVWRLVGILGTIADVIGWEWTKRLRINIQILSNDKGPVASELDLAPYITDAQATYKEFHIKLIVEDVDILSPAAPAYALKPGCDEGAFGDDYWLAGSWFETQANRYKSGYQGGGRRLIGYGGPVTVFVVEDVQGKAGCSLGPLSDYVTIEGTISGRSPKCLAHELGHACGYIHHAENVNNLMSSRCGGTRLTKWQRIVIRSSRHVTYF